MTVTATPEAPSLTTPKMDPEVKAEWVAALRSGEYQQATGKLTDGGGYCCLGVLCELAAARGVVTIEVHPGYKTYDGASHTLPTAAHTWAGLRDANPTVPVPDEIAARIDEGDLLWHEGIPLAAFNDGNVAYGVGPLAFNAIADIIEEQL